MGARSRGNVRPVVAGAQHHDRRIFDRRDLAGCGHAVGAGHANVDDHEVRPARPQPVEGRLTRSREADGLEAGRRLDDLSRDDEEVWLIVHDEDADVLVSEPPVHCTTVDEQTVSGKGARGLPTGGATDPGYTADVRSPCWAVTPANGGADTTAASETRTRCVHHRLRVGLDSNLGPDDLAGRCTAGNGARMAVARERSANDDEARRRVVAVTSTGDGPRARECLSER
jgi:hypothetical protein